MNYENIKVKDKDIFLVDMKRENNIIFSELVYKGIKKYIDKGKKICIIVNKKGFSGGTICNNCGYIPKCNRCDIPIAYHLDNKGEFFGICHICKNHYEEIGHCNNCGGHDIHKYGTGTQKVQKYIKEIFGKNPIIVQSEYANSERKINNLFSELNSNNIIISTSLMATPLKNYNFDLIIFLNGDSGLNIPDYQANYRNFLFLYETIKNHNCKNFIVQTLNPENYSIKKACQLDFEGFKEIELGYRKDFGYPPFYDTCVLLYKHEIEQNLFNNVNSIYQELLYLKEKYQLEDIEIFPTPPLIYKIFGKYRYNIVLKGKKLREFMEIVYSKLNISKKGFKIDRNADNLIS